MKEERREGGREGRVGRRRGKERRAWRVLKYRQSLRWCDDETVDDVPQTSGVSLL